ncbi:MAG: hypothetical protein HY328_08000 [Chloroflexi bacterium]|nr:hypothetical protein [Chloroflexota bacterium]
MQTGDLDTALLLLEQARSDCVEQADAAGELQVILLLAQVHHRREDLGSARLYTEEAAVLLAESPALDTASRADAYLGLARLAPDTGQLAQGFVYAQEALRHYQKIGSRRGEYDAHILSKLIAQQRGHHQIAMAHLQAATQLARLLDLGAAEQTFLLNTRAHTCWYRGQLTSALQTARQAVVLADSAGPVKFRVYNRLLCANILRARQEYADAEAMYRETSHVLEETGFSLFQVWIEVNWAWLDVLQARYDQARRRLYMALETADKGQAMSFNVFLAGVFALTDRFREAEDLLADSLHFYLSSGDELSVCATRLHLAYVHLKTDRIATAEEQLTLALAWASEWNVEYFPHWWHPQIVAAVCCHALASSIYPGHAERILVKHTGAAAIPQLRALLGHAQSAARQRAADALRLLNQPLTEHLKIPGDETVRRILTQMITDGQLQPTHLERLARLLTTAHSTEAANPVLLATFGLYTHGASRGEIAQQLGRSESTIRNYITYIYECFGLAHTGSRLRRRARLVEIAQGEGYIR